MDILGERSPAEIVGDTRVRPGQTWLSRSRIIAMSIQIQQASFDWLLIQRQQPMTMQVDNQGLVITQGHHRFVAARIAGIPVPVMIALRYDYWDMNVSFASHWENVVWIE